MRKIIRLLIFFLLSSSVLKSQTFDQTYEQMHGHCAPCDLEYKKSLERGESSHCEQIKNMILLNECYIRVKCGNLPKRQEHIIHWKQEFAKYNCDDLAELDKIPPDDHCNFYRKMLSMYERDRQELEVVYGKEGAETMLSKLKEDIAFHCSKNSMQRSSQNSYTEEIEQGQAQRKTEIIIETQNYLSAEQQNRREYYQEQLQEWKKDLAKYDGARFGSEASASYYEEKYTDKKASASVQDRLQNYQLDDDEFLPGDLPASEPDNMFVRVSQEELKRRLEQATEESKKERDEKETQMCVQADDDYVSRLPSALRVDPWNNPVNEAAMLEYVRKNGSVIYQENGVVLTYLIHRAIHESGLYYKVCSVDTSSNTHSEDRSVSNDGRVFHWYNLYYILENKSDSTSVTFQRFPGVEISMTGESSWGLCDEWLCAGTERFGNNAKLSMVASPHVMQPNSMAWDFEGAWYPNDRPEPQLTDWIVGKFITYPFKQNE